MVDGMDDLHTVFAHSRPDEPESCWEPLDVHLLRVANLAARFADAFEAGPWARAAGLWHDLGKALPEFQARLRGSHNQVEHAGVGAALAAKHGSPGLPLAFAIAGHHAGLANLRSRLDTRLTPLMERIESNNYCLERIAAALPQDWGAPPPPLPARLREGTDRAATALRAEFWTRMVFSVLVDADRLATEGFYEPEKAAARGFYPSLHDLEQELTRRLDQFAADSVVNVARAEVLRDCRQAASLAPGVFSLTAPTGSGKTLSGMAFALAHALKHDLRRVIVVVPYTSIIEQNAKAYRSALTETAVIEHHSNIDEWERETADSAAEVRRRLATENWDAPVIVTTTVQFLESLLSNHPGSCRKIHNIARSVIILDEAQCLPTKFLRPILDVLKELTASYGCSLVISTATQPALGRRETLQDGLDDVREIIRDPRGLASRLERVRVRLPTDHRSPRPYSDVAVDLATHPKVLAVVHRRADARTLAMLLPSEGRFHLSALMCPAHRLHQLSRIKTQLSKSSVCRVVSTQLVEAGVDLDFPVVYRALAGLDSLAQAAGRCNREGRLPSGEFVVFRAETAPPPGALRIALEATDTLLEQRANGLSLSDPSLFEEFFRLYYHRADLDHRGIQTDRAALNFATVADRFRLIEDGYQRPVAVSWGDGPARLEAYERAPSRITARALQPFIVQIPDVAAQRLVTEQRLRSVGDALLAVAPGWETLYSEEFGLAVDADDHLQQAPLIV